MTCQLQQLCSKSARLWRAPSPELIHPPAKHLAQQPLQAGRQGAGSSRHGERRRQGQSHAGQVAETFWLQVTASLHPGAAPPESRRRW